MTDPREADGEPTATGSSPENGSILRFAVAMRGGVSLAVWIGGALGEIDRLRRADPDDGLVRALLQITRFDRLEVDILAGASAGGLNAALGGAAIASGAPLDLRDVWIETASLDRLLEPSSGPERRRSLLNGDFFRVEITEQLGKLFATGERIAARPVEIMLAATVFGGVRAEEPEDRAFSDVRREVYFHARHFAGDAAFSDMVGTEDAVLRIGTAARATASFPVAFEPVPISTALAKGILRSPDNVLIPPLIRLFDGGIVDNIPVARAIQAAASAPAQDAVRRWIVFLHPSPSIPALSADRPGRERTPSPVAVFKDVLGGLNSETLLDDLEVLRCHNRESESQRLERLSLCEAALAGRRHDVEATAASVDADHLYALLADPAAQLSWVPISEDPPRSPIADYDEDQRFALRMELLETFTGMPAARPFARVIRAAHLVIEWIRWTEAQTSAALPNLRRRTYDVMLVARLIDACLDRAVLNSATAHGQTLLAALSQVRSSSALHELVDELDEADMPEGRSWVPLLHRLPEGLARSTFESLARNHPPLGRGARSDLDERLLGRLIEVAGTLLSTQPERPPARPSLLDLLNRQLGREATQEQVRQALITVDHACSGFHRGRAVGAPMPLRYHRISGAQTTPLAHDSAFTAASLPRFAHIIASAGSIDPKSKLSGNALANFSAFVADRFRANDWMWGRMDAAGGMVDILLRPEHLEGPEVNDGAKRADRLLTATSDALNAAFDRVADAKAARSAEIVCRSLWTPERRREVRSELLAAVEGNNEAMMTTTKALLTIRWQLEAFLEELPRFLAAEVQPGDGAEVLPELDAPIDVATATANLERMMNAYQTSPRSLASLRGRRRTAALGVRVARAGARAMTPETGPASSVGRVLLAAPMMVAASAGLTPGAFLVATSLLSDIVLQPRLDQVAQVTLLLVGTVVSYAFYRSVVWRPGCRRTRAALAAAIASKVVAVGTLFLDQVPFAAPQTYYSSTLLPVPGPLVGDMVLAAGVVGLTVGIAAALLWIWAKPVWILGVSLLSGFSMAFWVLLGSWRPTPDAAAAQRGFSLIGSMWVPAVFLAMVATSAALIARPEDRTNRVLDLHGAKPLVRSQEHEASNSPGGSLEGV